MATFFLTAFNHSGEKLLDETVNADTEMEAKKLAEKILIEKDLINTTHRCTTSTGKLLLFHR